MAKRLLCYLGRHRWRKKVVEGQIYYECRHCGKTRDPTPGGGLAAGPF